MTHVRAAVTAFMVVTAFVTLLDGCGGTSGVSAAQAVQPVKSYLRALQVMGSDVAPPELRPLPPAAWVCKKLPGWPDNPCLRAVARRVVPDRPAPKGSAQACAALAPQAQRELIAELPKDIGPAYASPIAELAGGARYPPACADVFRILGAFFDVPVAGVMDNRLLGHANNLARLGVVVVRASGKDAEVRVGRSHKTVHVRNIDGRWLIASLDFSDLNRR